MHIRHVGHVTETTSCFKFITASYFNHIPLSTVNLSDLGILLFLVIMFILCSVKG